MDTPLYTVLTAGDVTACRLSCEGGAGPVYTSNITPADPAEPWEIWGLRVGDTGEGSLSVEGGGVVSSVISVIGYESGSWGVVRVSGEGSQWNNSGYYGDVGYYGSGTLNVEAGGVVSTSGGSIGYHSGSVGTVTVTGEGSEWNNSSYLYVGRHGSGTLNITDGGVVSWRVSTIGLSSDFMGTVTVTGEGSELNNSDNLSIGSTYYSGVGRLKIEDGGVVNVAATTRVAPNSTLEIELSNTTSGPFLFTDGLQLFGGTLEISLADGCLPELSDTFDILDFNTVSGNFAEMNLPVLEDGLLWDSSQLLVDGTLCAGGCIPLVGDFNIDGTVDATDYTRWKDNLGNNSLALNGNGSGAATVVQADYDLWKDNFGRSGAGIGDFNSDGVINAADFTVWQDNLGLSASALNGNGSGAATVVQADYLLWKTNFEALASGSGADHVPEPVTLLLTLLALVAVPLRVRHG